MAEGQPSRNLTDGGGDLSGIWQSFERATNAAPVDRYEFRRDGERYYVVRPPGGAINEGDYFTFDGAIGRHVKGPTNKMLPSGELHWDIDGWKYVSRREGAAQTMRIQLAWQASTSLVIDILVLIVRYVDPTGTATPGGTCIFVSSQEKNKVHVRLPVEQALDDPQGLLAVLELAYEVEGGHLLLRVLFLLQ